MNETRFEYERDKSHADPAEHQLPRSRFRESLLRAARARTSSTTQNHIELQNYTSIQLAEELHPHGRAPAHHGRVV